MNKSSGATMEMNEYRSNWQNQGNTVYSVQTVYRYIVYTVVKSPQKIERGICRCKSSGSRFDSLHSRCSRRILPHRAPFGCTHPIIGLKGLDH
jgi:hypothetical protein